MKTFTARANSTKVGNIVNQGAGPVVVMSFELQQILLSLGPNPNATVADVTVGASPFIYQNTTEYPLTAVVSGGTVSDLAFSRDGVNFYTFADATPGSIALNPGDMLRATYTVAPTLTIIPR